MQGNPFFSKMYELEQDYVMMKKCLDICNTYNTNELHNQIIHLKNEYEKAINNLDTFIKNGRSQAVCTLAQAQKAYYTSISDLTENKLPVYLHSESSTLKEDESEAMMLYTEYAIDFAQQSIRHALITALTALEIQQNTIIKKGEANL